MVVHWRGFTNSSFREFIFINGGKARPKLRSGWGKIRSASSTADLQLFSGFSSGVSRMMAFPRSNPRRHWIWRGSGVYGTGVGEGGSAFWAVAATLTAAKQRITIQSLIVRFLLRQPLM